MSQLLDHLNTTKSDLDFSQLTVLVTPLKRLYLESLTSSSLPSMMVSFLTLQDVSAAFGTIDHNIRVPPSARIGFQHTKSAVSFFQSYLTKRMQTASISGYSSNPPTLRYGVPQRPVLGPILFHLYTQPLSQINDRHSVSHS